MYVNKKPRELKAEQFYNLNEVVESKLLLKPDGTPYTSKGTAQLVLERNGIKSVYDNLMNRKVWKIPGKVIIDWNNRVKATNSKI